MDTTLRDIERRAAADPTDGAAVAQLARALARAGRLPEARATIRTRIAAGEIDADTIALVLELGESSIQGTLQRSPRANFECVAVRNRRSLDGLVEIAPPVVAFSGVPGAGALETVLALRDLFKDQVEDERTTRIDDERVLEVRVGLARPWIVTRSYAIRSIRLVAIPVAPHAVKVRARLLKATSALAFVVDARSEQHEARDARSAGHDARSSNEAAWKALAKDFRRVKGHALEELPAVFLYPDEVEEAWHRWLTVACGLRRVPRVTAVLETTAPEPEPGSPRFARFEDDDQVTRHEGALEVLALLLAGVASAVKGVAAPRPRFRR